MPIVKHQVVAAAGLTTRSAVVTIRRVPNSFSASGQSETVFPSTVTTGPREDQPTWPAGYFEVDLPRENAYAVVGYYSVGVAGQSHSIQVPSTGDGPFWLSSIVTSVAPPTDTLPILLSALRDTTALAGATNGQVPAWEAATSRWVPATAGTGGAPSGPAGGVLTGAYPNPSLAAGAVGATEIAAAIKDPAAATAGLRTLGTGATQAAAGNDVRLSDARTPLAHTHAQADVTGLSASLAALQPLDNDLTTIAALAPPDDAVLQRKAGAWSARTPTQVKSDLALVKGDVGLGNVDNTSDTDKPISAATQAALDALTQVPVRAYTGDHTMALVDAAAAMEFTAAGPVTLTVPPHSSVPIPVDTISELVQVGTGQVTVVAGAGVTIRTSASLTTRAQWSVLNLRQRALDDWLLSGDMT